MKIKSWRIVLADGKRNNLYRNAIWKNATPPHQTNDVYITMQPGFRPPPPSPEFKEWLKQHTTEATITVTVQ